MKPLRVDIPGTPPSVNLGSRVHHYDRAREVRVYRIRAQHETLLAMVCQGWTPPWWDGELTVEMVREVQRQCAMLIVHEAGQVSPPDWRPPWSVRGDRKQPAALRFRIQHVVASRRGDPANREKVVVDGVCDALGIDDRTVKLTRVAGDYVDRANARVIVEIGPERDYREGWR